MEENKLRVAIDLDGTIVQFTEQAIKNVKKTFNIDIDINELSFPNIGKITYMKMNTYQRNMVNHYNDLYKDIVPIGFFEELNPYPSAIESVKELYNRGCKIIFVTKPMEWKYSTNEKMNWLKKYFSDIQYDVIMVDSMFSKSLIDVDVLVDDDAFVLMKLPPNSGICIKRPWNKEYREKSYEGICVDEFTDAAKLIIKNMDYYKQKDKGGFDAPKGN